MSPKHTTVRLSPALVAKAKAYAEQHAITLTKVMECALVAYIAPARGAPARAAAVRLPAFGRGGARPGVNLDSNAELLDLMDGVE